MSVFKEENVNIPEYFLRILVLFAKHIFDLSQKQYELTTNFNKELQLLLENFVHSLELKSGIVSVVLFGSYAKGNAMKESDIDIMIRLEPKHSFSLFDLVGLQLELAEHIGQKVDLVTEKGLDKYIRKYIIRDLLPIYSR